MNSGSADGDGSPSPHRFRYTGNGMHITLLNDILFKVVFGTQRHSEALRGPARPCEAC